MMILHNEFKPESRPGEPISTPAEVKREDLFEKTQADPNASGPYHLNVYIRTFLEAMILLGLIFFYIVHLSGSGPLGTYGQPPYPSDANRLR